MRRYGIQRSGFAVVAALAGALLTPATGLAADFYVDRDTGDDANNVTNCQQAAPCASIASGVTTATNAGSGNTVRVDDSGSPYQVNSNVTLFNGVSVIADNSVAGTTTESPTGRPILENGAAATNTFQVTGDTAGTISGFTFRPEDDTSINASNGTLTAIQDNVFEDPGASGADRGISIGLSSPLISGNVFSAMANAISFAGAGSPQITANEFTGSRGNAIGAAIGSLTLTGNLFHNPGAGATQAVRIGTMGATNVVSAAFKRNRILGGIQHGVVVVDAAGPISFDGDLIAGATIDGIGVTDVDDSGDSAISATNVTIVSAVIAVAEISVDNTVLTLDSSILGAEGITPTGDGTCAITFSRGPVSIAGGTGCQNFQTTADPMFVNPGGGDFHLLAASPMIDAGNPAAPPGGTLDVDGDARALDGTPACSGDVARRDIGADEFVAALPNCTPPATPAKKKCKKGRKLKKGKCVKTKGKRR